MQSTITIRAKIVKTAYTGEISSTDKVLDIGAGNGVLSNSIQQAFGCEMHATDIHNYLKVELPFFAMKEGFVLPFDNNAYDLGIFTDVLHHCAVPVQIKMLKEASRVCKRILIFETSPSFMAFFLDKVLNYFHDKTMPVPLTHRKQAEWEQAFAELKMQYIRLSCKQPFWYPIKHIAYKLVKA